MPRLQRCCVEYYSAIKMKKILPFAETGINLEDIMLSEMSQTEKIKYCLISRTCGTLES